MKRIVFVSCCILLSSPLIAAIIYGKVLDPAGAGVNGARIVLVSRLGVLRETTSDPAGNFRLDPDRAPTETGLELTAPGFARQSVAIDSVGQSLTIHLAIASVSDSITVTGSVIAAPVSEQ